MPWRSAGKLLPRAALPYRIKNGDTGPSRAESRQGRKRKPPRPRLPVGSDRVQRDPGRYSGKRYHVGNDQVSYVYQGYGHKPGAEAQDRKAVQAMLRTPCRERPLAPRREALRADTRPISALRSGRIYLRAEASSEWGCCGRPVWGFRSLRSGSGERLWRPRPESSLCRRSRSFQAPLPERKAIFREGAVQQEKVVFQDLPPRRR